MAMASARTKAAGVRRTGNGLVRQDSNLKDDQADRRQVGAKGHGQQAQAWNSSLSFDKLPKETPANESSTSTSPETDPDTSDVFPFFKEGANEDEEAREEDGRALARGGEKSRPVALRRTSRTEESYRRNPMFHSTNAAVEKAVASLFPAEDETLPAMMNGSNPMFNRSVSADTPARAPRPKVKRDKARRSSSSKAVGSGGGSCSVKDKEAPEGKGEHPRKKKEKAMYEHVGRMNVRPFHDDDEQEEGEHLHGFRVDTFARNEGESGGKAHFKFVFTMDGAPPTADTTKKMRPVLDAVHERRTGNLRIRVNDGREISATNGAAVEIALTNVGVVLFNPKTMAKGHHLYTLSLQGRTLFSVLA